MATKTFTVSKQYMADTGTYGGGAANPGDSHIPIGKWDPGTGLSWQTRALLYAPVNFSGMTAINEARLYFYTHTASGWHANGSGTSKPFAARRKTADWSETSGGVSSSVDEIWGGNGSTYVTSNYVTTDGNTNLNPNAADGTLQYIVITETVRDWFEGSPNYGVMVSVSAGGDNDPANAIEFYSRHVSGKKPYIWIDYATNTAPNAPTSLSPTGDAVRHTGSSVTVSGTRSDPDSGDYITAYQIQVVNDAQSTTYSDTTTTTTGTPTTFSKTISSLPTNVFLKWRARTRDKENVWGAWSSYQRFKLNTTPNAPTLALNESPTTDVKTLTPTFLVTHSDPDSGDTKAYKYEIELETSTNNAVWDSGEVTLGTPVTTVSKLYNGPALSWATAYRWRARTQDMNGQWSAFSSYATFTTHEAGVPISLSPSGIVVGSLVPTFSGSRASSADSLTSAQIQVYDSTGNTLIWDSGTFTSGVTSTGFSKAYAGTTLAYSTQYQWRARVTSSVGGTSDWSSLQPFTTPAADAIQITAPLGSGITDLTPQIDFSRTDSFNAYEIEVRRQSDLVSMWDTGTVSIGSSVTSRSITYAGTALDWATAYEFRVRVSSDNGSTWGNGFTDWVLFETDAAGIPTLTAPVVDAWINDTTPDFTGTTFNAEVIATFRILLYASDQTTLVWDSGELAGSGTSFSKTYDGPALTRGNTYYWTARYTENTGPTGGYAALRAFTLNKAPNAPSNRTPETGAVVADTLTPDFTATFSDADKTTFGDTPTVYEVEVYRNSDDVLMHTLTDNTSLDATENTIARVAEGTALSYEVQYKWRTRYTDSFGEVGAWSSFNIFKPSQSPTVSNIAPASVVNSPSFDVTWTFTSPGGKAQSQFHVWISRDSDGIVVYDSGVLSSSASSHTIPGGHLVNSTNYTIHVIAYDSDALPSAEATETINSSWTAPDPIEGFSVSALEETSTMLLVWDASSLDSNEEFSYYQIYRRKLGESEWNKYAQITNKSVTEYSDFYAGNSLAYQYKITVWKKVVGDVDVESPDSDIPTAVLESDVWFVIGNDRSEDHSFELPVSSESHAQPVQQEVFEPLGSDRKSVVRGRVLGNEGTLELTWRNDEHLTAQEQINYLVSTAGPHILKSPFGDVWEVEFAGPNKRYMGGGHLGVSINWIEVR